MQDIADEVTVNAPLALVWKAIQDPGEHVAWHPFATRIDGEHALGAVRTCAVQVGRKPGTTRERCTAYDGASTIMWTVEHDSSGFSRMVADWRTGFSLAPQGPDATRVRAVSQFRPKGPVVRVMMPAIRRKFHQTQRAILDGLKQHAER
jgi:carbon monoxide dehydrogenase subunit G